MKYIRDFYGVPAKRGGRIYFAYDGSYGTIVAAKNARLRVRFDGESRIDSIHPTWAVEYLREARE